MTFQHSLNQRASLRWLNRYHTIIAVLGLWNFQSKSYSVSLKNSLECLIMRFSVKSHIPFWCMRLILQFIKCSKEKDVKLLLILFSRHWSHMQKLAIRNLTSLPPYMWNSDTHSWSLKMSFDIKIDFLFSKEKWNACKSCDEKDRLELDKYLLKCS